MDPYLSNYGIQPNIDSSVTGKVFITGATGQTGYATVKYLNAYFPNLLVVAGVKDVVRAKERFASIIKNLEFALVDAGFAGHRKKEDEIVRAMQGCDAVLVVPPVESRVEVAKAYADCAQRAHVQFIGAISAACVAYADKSTFGRQFAEIEAHIRGLGIRHAFLRCEMFADNHLNDANTVKRDHKFYYPVEPDARFDPIATSDVGAVAATVLARNLREANFFSLPLLQPGIQGIGSSGSLQAQQIQAQPMVGSASFALPPQPGISGFQQQQQQQQQPPSGQTIVTQTVTKTLIFSDKATVVEGQETVLLPPGQNPPAGLGGAPSAPELILHLTGPSSISMTELAGIYSKIVLSDVKFVQAKPKDAIKSMIELGMAKWQAEGAAELWDLVSKGYSAVPTSDVDRVLGRKPIALEQFILANSTLFKPVG